MQGDIKEVSQSLQDEAMKRYNSEDKPLDQLRALIDSVEDLDNWFKERGVDEEEVIHECKPVIVGGVQAIVTGGTRPIVALGSIVTYAFQLGYATKELHIARSGEDLPDPS